MTKPKVFLTIALILVTITALAYINRERIIEAATYDPNYDYLKVLQSSPAYDDSEKDNIQFTYEIASSTNLVKLKDKYKLDQIAGTGSDFDKAKNLLKWLNDLILQDGSERLPDQRDAISLISYAQENKKGLNCRGLAIVLNEALLSIGIKSRYLSMLPRDLSIDSHVVVMAYIPEFEKWVYLDPSYNAYFLDDYNNPMSPQEVRQSFIEGKALKTNPDISWGGRPMDVVYTHYISKNIYKLVSPVYSSFGYDSSSDKKFIVLNPKGDNITLYGNIFSSTIIHNQKAFWAKP